MRDVISVERVQDADEGLGSLAQLARVADELLPPLIARLGVSDLGEIEVRQGSWRVRIRRATTQPRVTPPAAASTTAAAAPLSGTAGQSQPQGQPSVNAAAADEPTAISTAVGYFAVRPGLAVGHRVARGDVLGWVDVLGVRMEIVSPGDGIVGRFVTQPGDPVEYGQELVSLMAGAQVTLPSEPPATPDPEGGADAPMDPA